MCRRIGAISSWRTSTSNEVHSTSSQLFAKLLNCSLELTKYLTALHWNLHIVFAILRGIYRCWGGPIRSLAVDQLNDLPMVAKIYIQGTYQLFQLIVYDSVHTCSTYTCHDQQRYQYCKSTYHLVSLVSFRFGAQPWQMPHIIREPL